MAQVDSYTVDLPFDILPMIFKHLSTPDIRSCALANKEYHAAALPSLWSHVYPRNSPYLLQKPERAVYVHYAIETHVHLSTYDDPQWFKCLALCTNLRYYYYRSIIWRGRSVIPILKHLPSLCGISIWSWRIEGQIPLSRIRSLKYLTLGAGAGNLLLSKLPAELVQFDCTTLGIDVSSSQITPLTFKPFANVVNFAFSKDTLDIHALCMILANFPHLKHLEIRYTTIEGDSAPIYSELPALRSFTVYQIRTETLLPASVMRLLSTSSALELCSIHACCRGIVDPLLLSLANHIGASVQSLCVRGMIFRRTVLSKMDQLFPRLERLDMRCTDVSPIRIFRITRLLTNLRELYLNAEDYSQANWSREDAVAILTQGPIHLRCVRIDRKQWVKKWTPSPFRRTTEEIPWPGYIEVIEETVDKDIWDDCDRGIRPAYPPPFFAN